MVDRHATSTRGGSVSTLGPVRIFLSGPMGAGKSTVARELSSKLGAPAIDLDARIEARTGMRVEAIFASRGEPAFRALEAEELRAVVAEGSRTSIVSLGGGAVTSEPLRRWLLGQGVLVTLTASLPVLVRRATAEGGRPLLAVPDPEAALRSLLDTRASAYAECHGVIDTTDRSPADVAAEVARIAEESPVVVPLGLRTYRVEIGKGVRDRLPARARAAAPGANVLVVTDSGARRWADALVPTIAGSVTQVVLEAGETQKTVAAVERIWDAGLDAGLDRDGLVLGIGGGVVGDLAGFGASTLLRGVALGQVPTTLLSMVDSSVGGKTGFNRRQGKNLVGTFHQPRFVLCDVDCLGTLPLGERIAGLAEVVKSAWLEGEEAVAGLEREADALRSGDPDATVRAIRMSVALKAKVVTADERESGTRMLLNLGHTIGHALEAAGEYTALRHGEAVALGMVAAFRIARRMGKATPADEARAAALLGVLGLPTDLDAHLSTDALSFLSSDKKRRGGSIRFILPGAPGRTEIVSVPVSELEGILAKA